MATWMDFTINFIDGDDLLLLELSVNLRGGENEKKKDFGFDVFSYP